MKIITEGATKMEEALNIVLNVIGGLGIFLYGMENMANAM